MTGYDTFQAYLAIKLHLTYKSYNYFIHKRVSNCTPQTFEKRRDRFIFHRLGKRFTGLEELEFFLAANFFVNPKAWVGMLTSDDAQETYFQRRKIKESLEYTVVQDLKQQNIDTLEKLRESLVVTEGNYPHLLLLTMQREVRPETLIAIDNLTACMDTWGKKISDTIIYPDMAFRYRRYAPFLSIDQKKLSFTVRSFLAGQ